MTAPCDVLRVLASRRDARRCKGLRGHRRRRARRAASATASRTNATRSSWSSRSAAWSVCRARSTDCASASSPTCTRARRCPTPTSAHAVELLRRGTPDLIALGGDYVTDANTPPRGARGRAAGAAGRRARRAPSPCSAITTTTAWCRRRSRPRDSRCCATSARASTIRGEPVDIAGLRYWTRRLRRHRKGGAGCRADDAAAGARSAAAHAKPRRSTCSSCSPATPMAARSCCRASARSPRAVSP